MIRAWGYWPPGLRVIVGVDLELLFGLAAIGLLWRPASTRFFRAARQARRQAVS